MQGIWIREAGVIRRPKSKKEVRELLAERPEVVHFESTSFHGEDRATSGSAADVAKVISSGGPYGAVHFVGPDPAAKRNFYGTITNATGSKWVVK